MEIISIMLLWWRFIDAITWFTAHSAVTSCVGLDLQRVNLSMDIQCRALNKTHFGLINCPHIDKHAIIKCSFLLLICQQWLLHRNWVRLQTLHVATCMYMHPAYDDTTCRPLWRCTVVQVLMNYGFLINWTDARGSHFGPMSSFMRNVGVLDWKFARIGFFNISWRQLLCGSQLYQVIWE